MNLSNLWNIKKTCLKLIFERSDFNDKIKINFNSNIDTICNKIIKIKESDLSGLSSVEEASKKSDRKNKYKEMFFLCYKHLNILNPTTEFNIKNSSLYKFYCAIDQRYRNIESYDDTTNKEKEIEKSTSKSNTDRSLKLYVVDETDEKNILEDFEQNINSWT